MDPIAAFVSFWGTFGFYYLLGYLGFILHWVLKPPKGVKIFPWLRENLRDVFVSLICYQIVVFIWWDMGIEFMGMPKGVPNGLTIPAGYLGSSIVIGIITKASERIPKKTNGNGNGGIVPVP